MRIEFKKKKVMKSKFYKFCEDNEADYYETDEDCGIWIIPEKYGEWFSAIKLRKDGMVVLGRINESCMNFCDYGINSRLYKEEQKWIIEILSKFQKYK